MIPKRTLQAIQDDPFLNYIFPRVLDFDKYLDETAKRRFRIRGVSVEKKEAGPVEFCEYEIPWLHRWHPDYDRNQVHQVLCIRNFYRDHPDQAPNYTMLLTRTGTHASPVPGKGTGGLKHLAYLGKLQEASRLHHKMTKKYWGKIPRLSILEPHPSSAFAHPHDFYFLDKPIPDADIEKVRNHYVNTLKMGSPERSWSVEIKEPQEFKSVQSFLAYILAYTGDPTVSNVENWTKNVTVYNTCLWLAPQAPPRGLNKIVRAFQPSTEMRKIIRQGHFEYVDSTYQDSWGRTTEFYHLDTHLVNVQDNSDPIQVNKCQNYDEMLKAYENLGGEV